jgi:GT2 family glycosyltransferase
MVVKNVSAIIVTYQSAQHIGTCLESLQATASEWLSECIIVDNASNDETVDLIRRNYPWVSIIANRENFGFGRAVNMGAMQAQGDSLFIVNPDTKLEPGAIESLALFLESRLQAGACGPKIVSPDGSFRRDSRRGFPTPLNALGYLTGFDHIFPGNRHVGGYHRRDISHDLEIVTDSLSGSCMMVRRSVFESIGGFDEDYFLFGEDIDLCWKIKHAGHEIWFVPSARVVHIKGASMHQAPAMAKREFYRSMRLFMDKRMKNEYSNVLFCMAKLGISLAEICSRRFHKRSAAR